VQSPGHEHAERGPALSTTSFQSKYSGAGAAPQLPLPHLVERPEQRGHEPGGFQPSTAAANMSTSRGYRGRWIASMPLTVSIASA
jgi:hypothetical protein